MISEKRRVFSSAKRNTTKFSGNKVYGEGIPTAKSSYLLITSSRDKWKIQIKIQIFILSGYQTWVEGDL